VHEIRITFGTHYKVLQPGCMLCSSSTASGVYVCSSCNLDQLNRINEVSPDLRETMEQEEQQQFFSSQENVVWQPASGHFNISGLIQLTARSPRWLWKTAHLSGLAPIHDGHRAVWTGKQAQAFVARSGKQQGLMFIATVSDDGSLFMTKA
jgi:hypothetical protein